MGKETYGAEPARRQVKALVPAEVASAFKGTCGAARRECELAYHDRIPENLRESMLFDGSEEFVACVDAAMEALEPIV